MALFKVFRGDETNLPASMNDGWAYFCTDTGNFYIDWANGENLVRTQINANYANKLQYQDDEELVEINPQDIATKSDIPQIDSSLTIEGAAADAKAVGDTIASIPNADWNQNDATQPSYIENRTHWIEPVDFEWSGNPTFTATTSAEGNIYIFECATTDKVFNICTLSCGGSSWVVPVNQSKWVQFSPDSWVSFGPGAVSVLLHSGTLYLCAKSSGMGGMGTYNISNCGIVTYLPAAYIPSTIARLKDVVTSVNGQKGTVTIDIPEGVPDYTTSDNGKVLSVVDGVAGWSNVNTSAEIDVDNTLSIEGAAADAKAVGDALIKNLVDGANGSVRGVNTNAEIGINAFAEGGNTKATGYTAHAEGDNTTSSEHATHSEGVSTVASNYAAHAEGQETTASGHASHAEGRGTKASSEAQHVQGKWNVEDSNGKYAHIVGNGSSDNATSNAHTVDWNGIGWFAGGLKIGGTGQDDSSASEVALKSDIPSLGTLATKNTVAKSDLASSVQTSLNKADTALQSYTETDPTVPAWAKASTKPSYTASEVGLGNVDNVKQYSANNPPPYPVTSVNGATGAVTIKAVPSCSTSDNGKFLRVVNGAAAWSTIPNAEEATF